MRAALARLVSEPARGPAREGVLDAIATVSEPPSDAGTAGIWRLDLRLRRGDTDERRTLEDGSCEALAEATALIVAMAVAPDRDTEVTDATRAQATGDATRAQTAGDATRAQATGDATRAQAAGEALAPTTRGLVSAPSITVPTRSGRMAVVPTSSERPAPERPVLRGFVGAGAAADSGLLPNAGFAALALGGVSLGGWRAELALAYWPERRGVVAQRPSVGGFVSAATAAVSGCRLHAWTAIALGGCATLESGVVHGRGTGVSLVSEAWSPWLSLGAAGTLLITPTRSFAVGSTVALMAPIARPAFFIEGVGTFYEAASLTVRARIHLEVRF